MTNIIIYPLLIIIFSILVIYGILTIKNNNKFYKIIESYKNNYFDKTFKLDISDNTFISKDFANGTWTIPESIVNSDYTISNLMTITINPGPITNNLGIINNVKRTKTNNYVGFDQINFNFGTINYNGEVYNINYVLNENITAVSTVNNLFNMHIKLLNKFNKENDILLNKPYYIPDTLNAIVSIFNNNLLYTKFASYKVYNGIVGGEVYRIIKSKDIYIDQAPPLYDFQTYNVLMNNYKYPSNNILYSINSWTSNNSAYQTLKNNYSAGNILVAVQRIFYSPTGNTIRTKASVPFNLNVLNGTQVPTSIVISSFQQDKIANSLEKFFKPYGTAFYFYKLIGINQSFSYANPNITAPISGLNLQNNANNMYGGPDFNPQNFSINNLPSVQINNNNNYEIMKVQELPPDGDVMNSSTTFNFTNIISFL